MAKRRAHGEGSVVELADGTWRAVVPIGEGRRKWIRGATRAEVVRKATEVKANRDTGRPVTSSQVRLGDFLDEWLEQSVRPGVRPRTYDSYEGLARLHLVPTLGQVRLSDLGSSHVQRLLTELQHEGLAPNSIIRVHATLRRALTQAERWGLVTRNVAKLVDLPKVERHEIAPFTPEEARQLLAAIQGHRLEALFAVALAMGLPRGEALGLRWCDLNLDQRVMTIRYQLQRHQRGDGIIPLHGQSSLAPTKSYRSRRELVIPETLCRQLRAHRARQARSRLLAGADWHEFDLVFTTPKGTPLDGQNLLRQFRGVLAAANLPERRFHDLRHSCGSFLAAQGVPLVEIQAILGHSQIGTTMIYVHSLPESMRRAADQMDRILWGQAADGTV